MLEIKNLTYKYENHIALNNINLKIEKGEKIAILGNNGSGKTTLLNVIATIDEVSSGHIYLKEIMSLKLLEEM